MPSFRIASLVALCAALFSAAACDSIIDPGPPGPPGPSLECKVQCIDAQGMVYAAGAILGVSECEELDVEDQDAQCNADDVSLGCDCCPDDRPTCYSTGNGP